MYKTKNTGTGNGMRGTRGTGEIVIFEGMSPNIPGNVASFWCKGRSLLGRVAFRILSNIQDGNLL